MIKVFAHRGYVQNNIKQNSIASLKNAFKNGFKAVEFDIWLEGRELYITHDKPSKNSLLNLPRFRDYFLYENRLDYWLDFKNLDQNNVDDVLKIIKNDFESLKIDLQRLYFAPYITDYDLAEKIAQKFRNFFNQKINLVGVCDDNSQISKISELLEIEVFDFVSIDHNLIDSAVLKLIAPEKILAWTVNDSKIFNDLTSFGINKFATDKIVV